MRTATAGAFAEGLVAADGGVTRLIATLAVWIRAELANMPDLAALLASAEGTVPLIMTNVATIAAGCAVAGRFGAGSGDVVFAFAVVARVLLVLTLFDSVTLATTEMAAARRLVALLGGKGA